MIKISVIVPVFNLGEYLHQCVDSIISQTYDDIEIILVDDGSTDNSLDICLSFEKKDFRVKVIAKSNGGLVSARKAGLEKATGEYVFYVDGDDWIDSDCLSRYYEHAIEFGADVVIGGYKREFSGNYVCMSNLIPPRFYDRVSIEANIFPCMIYAGDFFCHGIKTYSWGKLYRREIIKSIQASIPNEIMVGEDAALIYPAIYNSQSIYITNFAGYNYRQRANSILKSTNFDGREIERLSAAARHLVKAFSTSEIINVFLHQIQAYFVSLIIIRMGAFMGNNALYDYYPPFGYIEHGSRVCLFNSGSFGQHVYKFINSNNRYNFVAWFDDDFFECQQLGMSVCNPCDIADFDFDVMLVASFDHSIKNRVLQLFDIYGMPKAKIRYIDQNFSSFAELIEFIGYDPLTFSIKEGGSHE